MTYWGKQADQKTTSRKDREGEAVTALSWKEATKSGTRKTWLGDKQQSGWPDTSLGSSKEQQLNQTGTKEGNSALRRALPKEKPGT